MPDLVANTRAGVLGGEVSNVGIYWRVLEPRVESWVVSLVEPRVESLVESWVVSALSCEDTVRR